MQYSAPLKEIHNRVTKRLGSEGHQPARRYLAEMTRLQRAVESIENFVLSGDKTQTNEARALAAHRMAEKLKGEATAARKRANEILAAGYSDIGHRIDAATRLTDSPRGQEIRAVFREMNMQQKEAAMSQAIEDQNLEIIGAVLKAPAMLSGFNSKLHQHFADHYEAKVAPDLIEEREVFDETDKAAQVFLQTVEAAADAAMKPSFATDLENAQQRARQASANFDEALGGAAA